MAYAGIHDLTGTDPNPWVWYDLTDDSPVGGAFPEGACGISIAQQANDITIEVLTTSGLVYETECDVDTGNPLGLDCTESWAPITDQPSAGDPPPTLNALRNLKPSKPLARLPKGVAVN
ncbi:hypothetical protein DXZ75_37385 [Streptomyces sp. AcE210]|nr:hypothetical protein DXZ75_37385 [Streptomyces sp. AcE210]